MVTFARGDETGAIATDDWRVSEDVLAVRRKACSSLLRLALDIPMSLVVCAFPRSPVSFPSSDLQSALPEAVVRGGSSLTLLPFLPPPCFFALLLLDVSNGSPSLDRCSIRLVGLSASSWSMMPSRLS